MNFAKSAAKATLNANMSRERRKCQRPVKTFEGGDIRIEVRAGKGVLERR